MSDLKISYADAIKLNDMIISAKRVIASKTGNNRELTNTEFYAVIQEWAEINGFPYEKFDLMDTVNERLRKENILIQLIYAAKLSFHFVPEKYHSLLVNNPTGYDKFFGGKNDDK